VVLLYAVALVLLVVCLVDVVQAPRASVRTLPKPLWLLVVLQPFFGPAAWLLAGRPRRGQAPAAPGRTVAPDDDEDFLRELRKRTRDPRDD
jgi:hypothetical protein